METKCPACGNTILGTRIRQDDESVVVVQYCKKCGYDWNGNKN